MIPTVKGFSASNEAEVDVFLEFSCFFYDLMDVGNLISDSSAFSKSILNISKFTVHIRLKPGLENFEHYIASMRDNHKAYKTGKSGKQREGGTPRIFVQVHSVDEFKT